MILRAGRFNTLLSYDLAEHNSKRRGQHHTDRSPFCDWPTLTEPSGPGTGRPRAGSGPEPAPGRLQYADIHLVRATGSPEPPGSNGPARLWRLPAILIAISVTGYLVPWPTGLAVVMLVPTIFATMATPVVLVVRINKFRARIALTRLHATSTFTPDTEQWPEDPDPRAFWQQRTITRALGAHASADNIVGWLHTYRQLLGDRSWPTMLPITDMIRQWPGRGGQPGWLLALAGIHPDEPLPRDITRESLTTLAALRGHSLPGAPK